MNSDWKAHYRLAMHEASPVLREELYEQARVAIHQRVLELAKDRADVCERGDLDEAFRQLTIHKYKKMTLVVRHPAFSFAVQMGKAIGVVSRIRGCSRNSCEFN
jgi:hypothetical protein